MSVLGSYLGSMPPLPALLLTHLPSGDEIYQYPPNTPIVAPSVLQWLQKIEDRTESPAGKEEVVLERSVVMKTKGCRIYSIVYYVTDISNHIENKSNNKSTAMSRSKRIIFFDNKKYQWEN